MRRSREVLRAVVARESRAFFGQPSAWVFLAAFLFVSALLGLRGFFERNVADLRDYSFGLRWALMLLAPAATMRLWAEERRAGTIELLLTLPLRPGEAVLGKYLASLAVVGAALLLGATFPLSLAPFADFDPGQVLSGYLGALLLAAAFLAVGGLASAVSPSQEVAFVAGALACGALNLLGDPYLLERMGVALGEDGRWLLDALGALALGTHHEALSRGVLETRGLVAFGGVTLAALFWTALAVERRGRASAERGLAAVLAGAAVLLAVSLANHRRLSLRFDLTRRGLHSLSADTLDLLARVRGELTVRAYLSRDGVPLSAEPLVRELLDFLDEVAAAGGERVRVERVDPRTPELQADAEREGVQRFDLEVRREDGAETRRVFAGLVLFYEGRPAETIPVALGRKNLEYDFALALRHLVLPRRRIGVAGAWNYPRATAALERVHFVERLDLARQKQVPPDIGLVLYAAPTPPSEREVYVLDQFVARGGALLLLAEGVSSRGASWRAVPHPRGPLHEALEAWGLELDAELVVQEPWRTWALRVDGRQVVARYPWFVGPTGAGNQDSPVAANLGRVVMPFASPVRGPEVLLRSPPAWTLAGEQDLRPERRLALSIGAARPRPLAAAARGELRSAWAHRPGPVLLPDAGGGEDPLAIPLERPLAPGAVVVVGDTDFPRDRWIAQGDGLAFLLNLVDWAEDRGSLARLRAREARVPLRGGGERILGFSRETAVWVLDVVLLPLFVLAFGLGRLGLRRRRMGLRATALRRRLARGRGA
ncbi:MAG: hypothetical protein D6731_00030 [Planctomycetota bacterium]|nr:MAG: hypothetical protein D6731_00030 [Planctomycetota bacterium]